MEIMLYSILAAFVLTILITLLATGKINTSFLKRGRTRANNPPTPTVPGTATNTNRVAILLRPLIGVAIVLGLIMFCSFVFCGHRKTSTSDTDTKIIQTPVSGSRILRVTDYTTCSHTFDYKFEIETDGDPVWMKFPGIKDSIYYSGKGRFDMPVDRRDSGPVTITSATNSQVRIRIYEVY